MSPTHQDLSNETTLSQFQSCVPVPLKGQSHETCMFKKRDQMIFVFLFIYLSRRKWPPIVGWRLVTNVVSVDPDP